MATSTLIFAERDRDCDSVSWHFRRVEVDEHVVAQWERDNWRYMTTLADYIDGHINTYRRIVIGHSEGNNALVESFLKGAHNDPLVRAASIMTDASRSRVERWILDNDVEIGGVTMDQSALLTEEEFRSRYQWRLLEEDEKRGDHWNELYFADNGYASVLYTRS